MQGSPSLLPALVVFECRGGSSWAEPWRVRILPTSGETPSGVLEVYVVALPRLGRTNSFLLHLARTFPRLQPSTHQDHLPNGCRHRCRPTSSLLRLHGRVKYRKHRYVERQCGHDLFFLRPGPKHREC